MFTERRGLVYVVDSEATQTRARLFILRREGEMGTRGRSDGGEEKKKRAPDSVCGREGKAGEWLEHGRLRRRGGATISEWMPARIKKVNRDRELGGGGPTKEMKKAKGRWLLVRGKMTGVEREGGQCRKTKKRALSLLGLISPPSFIIATSLVTFVLE